MISKIEPEPKLKDKRIIRKFAWLPIECVCIKNAGRNIQATTYIGKILKEDGLINVKVWLEIYLSYQEFIEKTELEYAGVGGYYNEGYYNEFKIQFWNTIANIYEGVI